MVGSGRGVPKVLYMHVLLELFIINEIRNIEAELSPYALSVKMGQLKNSL